MNDKDSGFTTENYKTNYQDQKETRIPAWAVCRKTGKRWQSFEVKGLCECKECSWYDLFKGNEDEERTDTDA